MFLAVDVPLAFACDAPLEWVSLVQAWSSQDIAASHPSVDWHRLQAWADRQQGASLVFAVAAEGAIAGVLALSDPVRSEALDCIAVYEAAFGFQCILWRVVHLLTDLICCHRFAKACVVACVGVCCLGLFRIASGSQGSFLVPFCFCVVLSSYRVSPRWCF
jgi:hypothetical protein